MENKVIIKGWLLQGLFLMVCFSLSLMAADSSIGSITDRTWNFFRSSYALVIGIGDYENERWSDLENAAKDAFMVGNELEERGFEVTYRSNLKLSELHRTMNAFFYNKKVDEESRLFLWYSGHGYPAEKGREKEGYLVPADVPDSNDSNFKHCLFPIKRFKELSKHTKAKYVYMMFDSCFPSTIITEINADPHPLAAAIKNDVRQFICACPTVKQSIENTKLRDIFISILQNEVAANAYRDNYLTATEINKFIRNQLKTPYYGKIKGFDKGDFLFFIRNRPPQSFSDNLDTGDKGPEMVTVTGGTFLMGDIQEAGSKIEKPVHPVTVEDFAVSKFEITFEEYNRYCDIENEKRLENAKKSNKPLDTVELIKRPGDNGWGREKRPVINVSWEDAIAYCKWLSEQTDHTYRLPTEAEWEYMARANTNTKYWWGNDEKAEEIKTSSIKCKAHWDSLGDPEMGKTFPVISFAPNRFGICGTVGNVWEWTCSEYTNDYYNNRKETQKIVKFTGGGEAVVIRGGAWDEPPENCRTAHRKFGFPGERSQYIGFRIVREFEKF